MLLHVDLDGAPRVASKQLRLGVARPPLPTPVVTIDGVEAGAEVTTGPALDAPLVLEVRVPGASTLAIDWFASAGELDDADDARATLRRGATEPADDAARTVVVVVRDDVGAVAWRVLTLRPGPEGR